MGVRRYRIKDKVSASELSPVAGLRGEVIFGTGRHLVPYIDPMGHTTFITKFDKELYKDKNIVPIGGYQFAFCKMFNIGLDKETTLRVGDLNDEAPQMKIGVPKSEYISDYYDSETSLSNGSMVVNSGVNISALNFIFGFMIGDGGAREDNMTAIAPNYKNRGLYRAIPFRMSNDGAPMTNGKYFGKVVSNQGASNQVTSYYVKTFDNPAPHIVHAWATDNPNELSLVDDTVFASTSSIPIESYVEINMSIDRYDGRGFFISTDTSPRVNEIALVSGWYNPQKQDYEHLQMITHFTRPSIALSEGDSIEAVYRLYAR